MKKKIFIITINNSINYGAVLQNYALQNYLLNKGHDVKTITYVDSCLNFKNVVKYSYEFIVKYINFKFFISFFFKHNNNDLSVEILKFRNKYINSTDEYTFNDLLNKNFEDAIFVFGSDAIWAYDVIFKNTYFLGGFLKNKKFKKISYAASFGKSFLEEYQQKIFQKELGNFHSISLREKSGVNIVKKLVPDKEVYEVLDPTFLLSDYTILFSQIPRLKGKYVFCYLLNQDSDLFDKNIKFCNQFAKHNNLEIIFLTENPKYNYNNSFPSPNKFLSLIYNSEAVISNSFHGIVFSIKFHKKFIALARDSFTNKKNVRILNLLSKIELNNNFINLSIIDNPSSINLSLSSFKLSINIDSLQSEIDFSKNFIDEALK